MICQKHMCILQATAALVLLGLVGCGSGSQPMNSGNFSGTAAQESDRATAGNTSVASVTLSPANLAGGAPTAITINLNQPAPAGGIAVQLNSSDTSIVPTPQTVTIPPGETSATVMASTLPVSDSTTVAITALYGDTVAGTSLTLAASATTYRFSIGVKPAILTLAPGESGSATVTTKIKSGYSHALQLTVSKSPAGVSATLTPNVIPAPGAGTSNTEITVPSGMAPGNHFIRLTASDGTTSRNISLKLQVPSSGPAATFQGCWYPRNGHRYQGVRISVADPGTYPFDAYLYRGATCEPNQQVDEFGFGTPLNFGGWLFWFSDFGDQSDTSAYWYVGNDKSQCVNYAVAPPC